MPSIEPRCEEVYPLTLLLPLLLGDLEQSSPVLTEFLVRSFKLHGLTDLFHHIKVTFVSKMFVLHALNSNVCRTVRPGYVASPLRQATNEFCTFALYDD